MLLKHLQKNNLLNLLNELHKIDIILAEQTRCKGCIFCGGPLHQSNYPRKPRGCPCDIPDVLSIQYSFCCGKCRLRNKPPSCRFMGRRVYWQCVILVIMQLKQDIEISAKELHQKFAIPVKTICRWCEYFQNIFPLTDQWQQLRGRVGSEISNTGLPGNLLMFFVNFCKDATKGLIECIKFLVCSVNFYQFN